MIDLFFWISYATLWIVVIVLFTAVFLLYRYHGQLLLNSLEGRTSQGPQVGKRLLTARLRGLNGMTFQLEYPLVRPLLILFASTTCEPCRQARHAFSAFAEQHKAILDTLLVCRGNDQGVAEFAQDLPKSIWIVPDRHWSLGTRLRVSTTPFALIVDEGGIVRGKGMPATLEAFEWFIKQLEDMPEIDSANMEYPIAAATATASVPDSA